MKFNVKQITKDGQETETKSVYGPQISTLLVEKVEPAFLVADMFHDLLNDGVFSIEGQDGVMYIIYIVE